MSYQSYQQGHSPQRKIHTLTVHAQQTSILREQGCTCTPRQASIANLSTFIKDTKRHADQHKSNAQSMMLLPNFTKLTNINLPPK